MVEQRTQRAPRNHLTDLIARADWSSLFPAHRADGDEQPVGRPTCVAAHRFSDRLALAVVEDHHGRTYPVPLVVECEEVRRARPGDGVSEALVQFLEAGSRTLGNVEITTWHHEPAFGERAITVDQTNESVIVGDRAVVKWTFLAGEGPHPAPSMLAELERNGFTGMPRPWGSVQWRPSDGSAPRLLVLVTDFVPGAVDGWTWVVDDLRDATAMDDAAIAQAAGRAVGELIASFHRALAGTAGQSTADESTSWWHEAIAELDRALAATNGRAREVLAAREAEVRMLLDEMPTGPTPIMRVHGDLHVGQVLRSHDTGSHETDSPAYVLTDFDGNPVLSPAQRLVEQPAAVDVAGMAQSFAHAGLVVRKHDAALDDDAVDAMAEVARSAFLDAYRAGLGDRAELLDERLLQPLALRQVCREFIYAATHLPRWSYVPEAALPMLLRAEGSQENA